MRPVFETVSNCWNMRARDIYVVTYVSYLVEGGRGGGTREGTGNNNSRVNASLGPGSFA